MLVAGTIQVVAEIHAIMNAFFTLSGFYGRVNILNFKGIGK